MTGTVDANEPVTTNPPSRSTRCPCWKIQTSAPNVADRLSTLSTTASSDTKTLPVGLADTYASLRLEVGSAYTIVFLLMTLPLLVAMQWLGVDPSGTRAVKRSPR